MTNPFGQTSQFLKLAEAQNLSVGDLQRLYNSGLLSLLFRAAKFSDLASVSRDDFLKLLGLSAELYVVRLGGCLSTDQIVTALRERHLWVSPEITQEKFPLSRRGVSEDILEIVTPSADFTEEEGWRILADHGLERPTYEHAIHFAEQHGTTTAGSRSQFVLFLHQTLRGDRRIIDLHRHPDGNELRLNDPDLKFLAEDCVLAGVRRRK